jgi:hypothetical protein
VQGLDDDGLPAGNPRDLLAGTKLAASAGFSGRQTDTGEEIEVEFTPDNQSVVFAASTNRNTAAYAFTDSQLFLVGIGGGEPKQLTQGNNTWSQPRFTLTDARCLPCSRSGLERLQRVPAGGIQLGRYQQAPRRYRRHRSLGEYVRGVPDSRTVYFTAEDGNEKSTRVRGGAVQTLFGVEKALHQSDHAGPRRQTRCSRTGKAPARPAKLPLSRRRTAERWCSRVQPRPCSQLDLPAIESLWFTSSRGKRIHSFVCGRRVSMHRRNTRCSW